MKKVFVDSGGFFALMAARDHYHEHAAQIFARANEQAWQLVTTNAVIVETYSLILVRSRTGRAGAISFLDMISTDSFSIERIRRSDEDRAIRLVRAHTDKDYSLCDALSFVVMERLQLKEAISFDRHFREYGRFIIL